MQAAWAAMGLSEDTLLPPDVEQLALFSDAPEMANQPSESWWAKIWRYQGP